MADNKEALPELPAPEISFRKARDDCDEDFAYSAEQMHSFREAGVSELRAEVERLRNVGDQLSNVAFNWGQQAGYRLEARDCDMLNNLRRQWDAARSAASGESAEGGV